MLTSSPLQVNKKSPLHFLCENEAVSVDALGAILKAKPDTNGCDAVPLFCKVILNCGLRLYFLLER